MAASSSAGPALAPAQGKVDSEALIVVTFNVGARQKKSHESEKKLPVFLAKLSKDISGMLRQGAEVINLQEINDFWKEQVLTTMLPSGWQYTCSPTMMLLTLFAPTLELVQTQEVNVFPEGGLRHQAGSPRDEHSAPPPLHQRRAYLEHLEQSHHVWFVEPMED